MPVPSKLQKNVVRYAPYLVKSSRDKKRLNALNELVDATKNAVFIMNQALNNYSKPLQKLSSNDCRPIPPHLIRQVFGSYPTITGKIVQLTRDLRDEVDNYHGQAKVGDILLSFLMDIDLDRAFVSYAKNFQTVKKGIRSVVREHTFHKDGVPKIDDLRKQTLKKVSAQDLLKVHKYPVKCLFHSAKYICRLLEATPVLHSDRRVLVQATQRANDFADEILRISESYVRSKNNGRL